MKKVFETLKSFYGITANVGVLIPGFSFFSNLAPPIFKEIAVIVTALSAAVIIIIAKDDHTGKNKQEFEKLYTRRAIRLLMASFILILSYFIFMDYTTIVPADFSKERWQTGFGLESWSLTPLANQLMMDNACNQDKQTLLTCASVQKESVSLIWTRLSIFSAGFLLIFLFSAAAISWSAGWTFLAKSHHSKITIQP